MKYYFCLIDAKDVNGIYTNVGRKQVYENRSKWIEKDGSELAQYLTAGYVKGVDYVVYKDKAYMLLKTYLDLNESKPFVVIACTESISGCDR